MTTTTLPPSRRELFQDWLWRNPEEDEGRLAQTARALVRILFILAREFNRDAVPLRASALTFTVVLSMVPILALSTAVLKGLGAGNQMRDAAYQFIESLEAPAAPTAEEQKAPAAADRESPAKAEEEPQTPPTLTTHLKRAVDTIFNYVNKTNFATLGILGIAGLFITVITVMDTIEQAMNAIWQAESGRPLGRKVLDYLALMLLLPFAVNIGVGAMAALQSAKALELIRQLFPVPWAGPLLVNLFSLMVLVATLMMLYRFLPNTSVPLMPALAGAMVGALCWLTVQSLYIKLQIGVARYNAIYGSFATLPLFLLWIYMSWLVFLIGAEVAFAVHVWRHYSPGLKSSASPRARLALAFDLLVEIYEDFEARRPSSRKALSQRLGTSDREVTAMIEELERAGMVRPVADSGDAFVPGSPAERVTAMEVVEVVFGQAAQDTAGGQLVEEMLACVRSRFGEQPLNKLGKGA